MGGLAFLFCINRTLNKLAAVFSDDFKNSQLNEFDVGVICDRYDPKSNSPDIFQCNPPPVPDFM